MSEIKAIKKVIKDLQEYKYTLEPFSRASINTHNEILKFKKQLPIEPTSHDIIEILLTSYINVGMGLVDIIDIFDALEETDKFMYDEGTVTMLYNNIKGIKHEV